MLTVFHDCRSILKGSSRDSECSGSKLSLCSTPSLPLQRVSQRSGVEFITFIIDNDSSLYSSIIDIFTILKLMVFR